MDFEEYLSLPFLDVLVSCLSHGSLTHQVFLKKTHTDRYHHANYHNHNPHKYVIIKAFVTLPIQIYSSQSIPM